ncbi:hypothetical protein [Gluconacetobacter azotocaptans]|nr:hypothetical protein [Gluconacetobacter azotocaptans]GBQ28586.1 hypothetical protein AA13594_1036 [Gluconacetobacter azotocaptans DSM 13594]
MSDEQRRRVPAEGARVRPEMPVEAAPRGRNVRKPFGTREQKLAYPDREGYHRHWFNDEPGRIARAQDAGYTQVDDDSGKPVSMTVGVARGGGALIAYLMEIPMEWYREDMAAQEAQQQELLAQIRQGRVPGGPTGADRNAQYVPRDVGITIREERR